MQLWKRMQQYGLEVLTVLLVRNGPFHIGLSHNPDVASPCTDLSPNLCHNLWDHHMGHFFCHSMGLCGQAILMKEKGWSQMWIKINNTVFLRIHRTEPTFLIRSLWWQWSRPQHNPLSIRNPFHCWTSICLIKNPNVVYLNTFRIKSVEM